MVGVREFQCDWRSHETPSRCRNPVTKADVVSKSLLKSSESTSPIAWEWPKSWTKPSIQDILLPSVTRLLLPTYISPQHCTMQGFDDPTSRRETLQSWHFPSMEGRYRWNEVGRILPYRLCLGWQWHFSQLVHLTNHCVDKRTQP